jgi:hypothetical protein
MWVSRNSKVESPQKMWCFFGMSEIGTDEKHKSKQNYLGVNDTEQKQQTTTIVGGKSGCRDDKINNCFPGVIWGKL